MVRLTIMAEAPAMASIAPPLLFLLMSSVYGVTTLPRTAREQYLASHHIHREELQEGDLVFFHTLGKHRAVTHVGVYLRNNKFIHASVSGVMISDMNDGYYDKHFIGAGRITDRPLQAEGAAQAAGGPAHCSNLSRLSHHNIKIPVNGEISISARAITRRSDR